MSRIIKVTCNTHVQKRKLENFQKTSAIILKIKDEFFQKWRNSYLYPLIKIPLDKLYFKVVNSDISATGSYLYSIYCDILYGDLSTILSTNSWKETFENMLNLDNIFWK